MSHEHFLRQWWKQWRTNSANIKNFDLRSHFSNPLDIDIFNRGDIEIFGQYIIQEKLRRKLYKSIILNQVSVTKFTIYEGYCYWNIVLVSVWYLQNFHVLKDPSISYSVSLILTTARHYGKHLLKCWISEKKRWCKKDFTQWDKIAVCM